MKIMKLEQAIFPNPCLEEEEEEDQGVLQFKLFVEFSFGPYPCTICEGINLPSIGAKYEKDSLYKKLYLIKYRPN
jgi:hypothetical protein